MGRHVAATKHAPVTQHVPRARDGEDIATEPIPVPLPLQPALSLAERLAQGSADDVEAALRRIYDCALPSRENDALLSAMDLCAAVREFLRDSRAGERKGLAKVDHATNAVESEKTDQGPRVVCISSAFAGEPGSRIQLTRREALIRKVTW